MGDIAPADCVRLGDWVQLVTSAGEYVSGGTVTSTVTEALEGFVVTWRDVGTGHPQRSVVPPASGHVLAVIRGKERFEIRGNPMRVSTVIAGGKVTYAATGEHVSGLCKCRQCKVIQAGSVTAEKITVETVHLPGGVITAGPPRVIMVPTPAKDEAEERLAEPQEVRREVLQQAHDDEIVAKREGQLAAATEQLITELGEAGWRSQYFTDDSGLLPWPKAKAYTAWKCPRDRYAVTGNEKDLEKMLDAVDFTNPPDAKNVLNHGKARTTKTKVKTWHDIDGRPHTSTTSRPVRGVPNAALVMAWVTVVFGFVFLLHVLGVIGS